MPGYSLDIQGMVIICLLVLLLTLSIGILIFLCLAYTKKSLPGMGPGSSCLNTGDCSAGLVCENRTCRATEDTSCQYDSDCVGDLYCNNRTCDIKPAPKRRKPIPSTSNISKSRVRFEQPVMGATLDTDRRESPVSTIPFTHAVTPSAIQPSDQDHPTVPAYDMKDMATGGLNTSVYSNDYLDSMADHLVATNSPQLSPFDNKHVLYINDKQLIPQTTNLDIVAYAPYTKGVLLLIADKGISRGMYLYDMDERNTVKVISNIDNMTDIASDGKMVYGLNSEGELYQVDVDRNITSQVLKKNTQFPIDWRGQVLSQPQELQHLSIAEDGTLWVQGATRGFLLSNGKEITQEVLAVGERRYLGATALDTAIVKDSAGKAKGIQINDCYSLSYTNGQWVGITRSEYKQGARSIVRCGNQTVKKMLV